MTRVSPEEHLRLAMSARTATVRGKHARSGLSTRAPLDRTTHAMLLRQLYLSHFEAERFEEATEVAEQACELGVLADVLHQDVARAAIASGAVQKGIMHLRSAVRVAPASRRAFHYWTLGSTLFLAKRYDESISALTRAVRWGTHDKPLYRAHLALVRICAGEEVVDLESTVAELAEAPCGQGYGRFVLGHLAYAAGEFKVARRYLEAFLKRTEVSPKAHGLALLGECTMARATLSKMDAN